MVKRRPSITPFLKRIATVPGENKIPKAKAIKRTRILLTDHDNMSDQHAGGIPPGRFTLLYVFECHVP